MSNRPYRAWVLSAIGLWVLIYMRNIFSFVSKTVKKKSFGVSDGKSPFGNSTHDSNRSYHINNHHKREINTSTIHGGLEAFDVNRSYYVIVADGGLTNIKWRIYSALMSAVQEVKERGGGTNITFVLPWVPDHPSKGQGGVMIPLSVVFDGSSWCRAVNDDETMFPGIQVWCYQLPGPASLVETINHAIKRQGGVAKELGILRQQINFTSRPEIVRGEIYTKHMNDEKKGCQLDAFGVKAYQVSSALAAAEAAQKKKKENMRGEFTANKEMSSSLHQPEERRIAIHLRIEEDVRAFKGGEHYVPPDDVMLMMLRYLHEAGSWSGEQNIVILVACGSAHEEARQAWNMAWSNYTSEFSQNPDPVEVLQEQDQKRLSKSASPVLLRKSSFELDFGPPKLVYHDESPLGKAAYISNSILDERRLTDPGIELFIGNGWSTFSLSVALRRYCRGGNLSTSVMYNHYESSLFPFEDQMGYQKHL